MFISVCSVAVILKSSRENSIFEGKTQRHTEQNCLKKTWGIIHKTPLQGCHDFMGWKHHAEAFFLFINYPVSINIPSDYTAGGILLAERAFITKHASGEQGEVVLYKYNTEQVLYIHCTCITIYTHSETNNKIM